MARADRGAVAFGVAPNWPGSRTSSESTPSPTGRARSGRSVDLTLTAMCEFLRFAAASGLADSAVAAQLSERRYLAQVPCVFDVGENGQFRDIRSRALRTRSATARYVALRSVMSSSSHQERAMQGRAHDDRR